MEIRTKIQNHEIKYNTSNEFSLTENSFLANAIRLAYIALYNTYIDLKNKDDEKTKIFAEKIFGSYNFSILRKNIEEIIFKVQKGELKFLKQKTFVEQGKENKNILASVEKSKDSLIKIYTSFFDIKNFKDDRGGIVIHELAHLCGLEREEEKFSLKSAEALKNFCLLCAGKISLEEINKEKDKKESSDNKNEDELTYDAKQPRAPKGQPDGGQWIPQNGESSSGNSENLKPSNKLDSKDKKLGINERGKINDSIKPNGELANQRAKETMDTWKKDMKKYEKDLADWEKKKKENPNYDGEKPTRPIPTLSPEESQYIKDIREKYKDYSRELSPDKVKAIIDEVCDKLAKSTGLKLNSQEAKELIFGTAAVESDMRARIQDGGGPGLGLFQMEYNTFKNITNNDTRNPRIAKGIEVIEKELNNGKKLEFEDLIKNDKIAVAMARLKYLISSEKIKNGTEGLADYWKKHYNTKGGAGEAKDFVDKYDKYKNSKK